MYKRQKDENIPELLDAGKYDFIVDAIDTVSYTHLVENENNDSHNDCHADMYVLAYLAESGLPFFLCIQNIVLSLIHI